MMMIEATSGLLKQKRKERISFETRVYCKDRSIRWLQWNIVVKDGKWFVNARDITLVKQVEKIGTIWPQLSCSQTMLSIFMTTVGN